MDAPDTPPDGATAGPEGAPGAGGASPVPAVVAVLATWGPDEGLEATLRSLHAQDHADLSVLVLDAGSDGDPAATVAAACPAAYLRRLEPVGAFAPAANDVLATVEGAAYLLFVRRGVVLDPDAVRVLVEEAFRSNAGIAGPKVVDLQRPEVLLEVGMAIDHYGVPFTGIEPEEIDQEQHDAVRDVFFVSSTTMLVRADLFAELGGFDPDTSPGVFDLDLCWRARLLGARVLAVPDARVAHARTVHGAEVSLAHGADAHEVARNRLRVLLKCYGGLTLAWVLPIALVLALGELVVDLVTRRTDRARGVLTAWPAALRRLGPTRQARREVQRTRRVSDADVRRLMIRGSSRVRAFAQNRLHAGDRLQVVTERTRGAAARASGRLRRVDALVWAVFTAVVLLGSRDLVFGDIPAVGSFLPWPGASGLAEIYGATWRDAGLGSSHPVPPAFGVLAAWSSALLGDADVARTLLVVGALPIGALGAYRLARPVAASALPALAAMVAYASTPIPRNAIATGSLGPLVTFALAPFVVLWLLRASNGLVETDAKRAWRPILAVGACTAVAGAFWPAALLFPPLVALAFLLAVPLVGGRPIALRTAVTAGAGTAVALVLLLPWSFLLPGADGASLGVLPRPAPGLGHVLALRGGPAGAGVAPWGLLVAAAVPLVVATGPRLAWAVRAWVLAALAWAVAWVPGRIDPEGSRLALDAVLVPAAIALALAVGLGVAVVVADLRRVHFGWRQLTAVAAAAAVALPVLGVLGDVRHGDWGLPERDWSRALAWMPQEAEAGGFRVLWLGRPDLLPTGARAVDGIGWGLSEDGTADVRELWPAPGDAGTAAVDDAVRLARAGDTARLGHLLAPMGVRYVALIERAAPESGARAVADPALRESLTRQLDLAVLQSEPGMDLYENQAWAATVAFAPPQLADALTEGHDARDAATRAELAQTQPRPGDRDALELPGAGMLLLAERYDPRWRAGLDGAALEHRETFGWANGFVVPGSGSAEVRFAAGPARPALVLVQVLAWVGLVVLWVRIRAPRPTRGSQRVDASGLGGPDDPAPLTDPPRGPDDTAAASRSAPLDERAERV